MNTLLSPELASIEAFGEFMFDENRFEFTFAEAVELARALGVHESYVIKGLKAYGFWMDVREEVKPVRGAVFARDHDRFFGPGSMNSHGGSGWEQVLKCAGRPG